MSLAGLTGRARLRLAASVQRLLGGALVGDLAQVNVRSVRERAWDARLRRHLEEVWLLRPPAVEEYALPADLPPHFRRWAAFPGEDVLVLRDVVVGPRTGVVWSPEERLVFQESVGSLGRLAGWSGAAAELCGNPRGRLDGLCIPVPDTGYFHFVVEVLPRLLILMERFPEATLLASRGRSRYVDDALALVAARSHRLPALVAADAPVRAERVAFITLPEFSGFCRREDVALLRSLCADSVGPSVTGPRRLWVTRRRAAKRRLADEERTHALVTSCGFDVVEAERLALAEQMALFAGAEAVAGPHGAGLVNIVWGRPRTVVEVFPADYFNDCYARLAAQVGATYVPVDWGERYDEGAAARLGEALRAAAGG